MTLLEQFDKLQERVPANKGVKSLHDVINFNNELVESRKKAIAIYTLMAHSDVFKWSSIGSKIYKTAAIELTQRDIINALEVLQYHIEVKKQFNPWKALSLKIEEINRESLETIHFVIKDFNVNFVNHMMSKYNLKYYNNENGLCFAEQHKVYQLRRSENPKYVLEGFVFQRKDYEFSYSDAFSCYSYTVTIEDILKGYNTTIENWHKDNFPEYYL